MHSFDLLFFLNINRGVFFQIVCIICAEASAVREVLVTHNEVVYYVYLHHYFWHLVQFDYYFASNFICIYTVCFILFVLILLFSCAESTIGDIPESTMTSV